MSAFVLDASFSLTWCFPDRATPNTRSALRRMEAHVDSAFVPWIWQVEVGNALGKAAVRNKVTLLRAIELWNELLLLPIRQMAIGDIPRLMELAVTNNLSMYDTCYLQAAMLLNLPLATIDQKLKLAAEACGLATMTA